MFLIYLLWYIYVSIPTYLWLSICLFDSLPACACLWLPVCLPLCLSAYLSVCLSVCLSVYLSVCLFLFLFYRPNIYIYIITYIYTWHVSIQNMIYFAVAMYAYGGWSSIDWGLYCQTRRFSLWDGWLCQWSRECTRWQVTVLDGRRCKLWHGSKSRALIYTQINPFYKIEAYCSISSVEVDNALSKFHHSRKVAVHRRFVTMADQISMNQPLNTTVPIFGGRSRSSKRSSLPMMLTNKNRFSDARGQICVFVATTFCSLQESRFTRAYYLSFCLRYLLKFQMVGKPAYPTDGRF